VKWEILQTRLMAVLLVFSALVVTFLLMQSVELKSLQEQELRAELAILLEQSKSVIDAMEVLVHGGAMEELIDLQVQVSRMVGILSKHHTDRLVNYGILVNPYSSIEAFLILTLLDYPADASVVRTSAVKVASLKLHLVELNIHLERVYGPFVTGQSKSQDKDTSTLHDLTHLIVMINGRVARTIYD